MLQHERDRGQMKSIKRSLMERIFKYTCLLLLAMLIYCIPGFLNFRQIAHDNGLHFVGLHAWSWCLIGFVVFGIIKQGYYYLFIKRMGWIVKPKFQGEDKIYRLKSIAKQSFDTLYYLTTASSGYYLFREQAWFPKMAGGLGQCENIYGNFPDWPSSEVTTRLEWFYMLQLGKFLYSVTQSLIFRRADRKYYEFLLHHFIATTLILFSMLTNGVTTGAVIMIIHDVSDLPSTFIRGFIDTKYDNLPTDLIFFALWLGSWIYLRTVVFPFCIITQVIATYPNPSQLWWTVRLQLGYMGLLCCVLVCMHIFWIILLLKYAVQIIFKKQDKDQTKRSQ